MISSKHKYNFFAGNIFLAILFGLKTWQDYYHAKEFDGEIDHKTEDLNEMIGEADGAFFSLESFKKNQTIITAFKPPTLLDLYSDVDLGNRVKKENEKRLILLTTLLRILHQNLRTITVLLVVCLLFLEMMEKL